MGQWYIFTDEEGADIMLPRNYSYPVDVKPACRGNNKICAVYAEDDEWGYPAFDPKVLRRDAIRAMQYQDDYGIVALSSRYKKKKKGLMPFIRRLLKLD